MPGARVLAKSRHHIGAHKKQVWLAERLIQYISDEALSQRGAFVAFPYMCISARECFFSYARELIMRKGNSPAIKFIFCSLLVS